MGEEFSIESPQRLRTFKMRARGQRRKASSLGDIKDLQKAEEAAIAKDFLLPSKRIGIMDWNGFTWIPFFLIKKTGIRELS